jgi:hypothetical protein
MYWGLNTKVVMDRRLDAMMGTMWLITFSAARAAHKGVYENNAVLIG